MPAKTLKLASRSQTRAAMIERSTDGTPESVSISSDAPYLRYDFWNDEEYWEVLDHSPSGIDDERLRAGLPILFNHDRDAHLARAADYANDGHKLTLDASKFVWASGEFAENKKKDMESGALPDTSVGYELVGDGKCIGAKDEKPIYSFRWKLFEASLVTIPADATVGAGRQHAKPTEQEPIEIVIKGLDDETNLTQTQNKPNMKLLPGVRILMKPDNDDTGGSGGGAIVLVDAAKERAAALAEYKARCKKINDFLGGIKNAGWKTEAAKIAARHIDGDANFDDFRQEAFTIMTEEKSLIIDPSNRDVQGAGRIHVIGERGNNLSIGQRFVDAKEFREVAPRTGQQRAASMSFPGQTMLGARGKASLQTRAGFSSADLTSVNIQVLPGMVQLGLQRLTIMDLLAGGTTNAAALPYAKENSFGTINGAAFASGTGGAPGFPRAQTVGEAGLKPNWDADLTTDVANVKKIAVTAKVPDEFMADFAGMQSYIDNRLPYMVDLETEFQLLYGDGTGNNLKGIFVNAGVQTRAIDVTDDSTKAASLMKGLTDIRVQSQFEPDGFAFHPYDWETAQLLKDTNGRFLAGGPYYIPYTDGMFMEMYTFWGKPVAVTTSVTYGKPLAGCWKLGAQYFVREGMRIETTNSNEDDFRRNLIALRAEHRLGLATYRPVCFLEFTAWPART